MARKPFQKGNKLAKGGYRPGGGRKPDEFKRQCAALASSPHFFKWADDVIQQKPTETKIIDGQQHVVPASTNERTYLWEKLAAYGYGKPVSYTEIKNENGGLPLGVVFLPTGAKDKSA